MAATFDGTLRLITLESGVTEVDVQVDLYSDWKEWVVQGSNAMYPPAFSTLGGEPLGGGASIAPYFFLRNDLGWRIKPPEEDIEITLDGNLFGYDEDIPIFIMTYGTYDTVIRLTVSSQAIVNTVAVGSGLSTEQDERLTLIEKILRNKFITDPSTGVATVYDDDGSTELVSGDIFEDAAGTQKYRGQGAERRERLE